MESAAVNLWKIAGNLSDEDSARSFLESIRWPNGPICPHCGSADVQKLTPRPTSKKPGRKGLHKCRSKECRKQFTVTVGTIFEDSHIPLSKWLMAIHLLCSSKKGMSAHQLHRLLGVTYKSAWFMAHRIRYAMTQEPLASKLSGVVEVDETYIGGKVRGTRRGRRDKPPIVALVECGGEVRAFPMKRVTEENLRKAIRENVHPSARMMTDGHIAYRDLGDEFADHQVVAHHRREYVRGEAHTQTVEGYFSLLKRGIVGTYHYVGEGHLHRYVDEFTFRYNRRKVSDGQRAAMAIRATEGKRLMLKHPQAEAR